MKKIVSIICLFIFTFCAFAQTSANVSESVSALKEKVAKHKVQICENAQIIRVIRTDNIFLF
ncbi:MAG: hypothetical protein E7036_09745 [Opitutales bacterium]|nr:hypothetical protein [Opitutales bacterium]MBQ2722646.1 hypothetical protein [Opitutales bacterium]